MHSDLLNVMETRPCYQFILFANEASFVCDIFIVYSLKLVYNFIKIRRTFKTLLESVEQAIEFKGVKY